MVISNVTYTKEVSILYILKVGKGMVSSTVTYKTTRTLSRQDTIFEAGMSLVSERSTCKFSSVEISST